MKNTPVAYTLRPNNFGFLDPEELKRFGTWYEVELETWFVPETLEWE